MELPKRNNKRERTSLISINDHLENATGTLYKTLQTTKGFQIITACEDARFKPKK
jgi:hypothetical protein